MEKLDDILTRIVTKNRSPGVKTPTLTESTHLGSPTCEVCQGGGWVRRNAAVGTAEFGEIYRCRCRDEEASLSQAAFRIRFAGLPEGKPQTFDNFTVRRGTEAALAAAREYAEGKASHNILTLTGMIGAGKSHLLVSIARAMLAEGYLVKYWFVPALLDELRGSIGKPSGPDYEPIFGGCLRADVLFLDDLSSARGTEWAVEKVARLIEDRYSNYRHLVVSTAHTVEQTAEDMGAMIADRLWDKKQGKTKAVTLTSPSYRTGERW
jgi:DNA replication protein DnaC